MKVAVEIVRTVADDLPGVRDMYREAAANEGGLARTRNEITDDYVGHNFRASQERGVSLVAKTGGRVVGEIHAYRPVPAVFAHVLSDLTVAIHPDFQGQGIGRELFKALLAFVENHAPDILRVELIARESNLRAIRLYESLGFQREGRLEGRIRNSAGELEADIPLAWIRRR